MLNKTPKEPDEFDFDEDEFDVRDEKYDINDAADKIIEEDLFGFAGKAPEEKPKDDDLKDAVAHVKKGEAIAGSYNKEMEGFFKKLNELQAGDFDYIGDSPKPPKMEDLIKKLNDAGDYDYLGASDLVEITEKRTEEAYETAKGILERAGYKDLLESVPEGPVTPEEKAEVFGSPREKPYKNLSLVVADVEKSIKDVGFRNKSKISVLIYQALDKLGLYPTERLIGRQVKNLHKMQSKLEGEIEEYHQKLEDERELLKKAGILMERYAQNHDSKDERDSAANEVIVRNNYIKTNSDILEMLERQYYRIDKMLDDIEDFNFLRKDFGLRKAVSIMREVDKSMRLYAP